MNPFTEDKSLTTINRSNVKELELPVLYSALHFTERKIVREEYISRQEGKCHHCKGMLFKDPPMHVASKPINKNLFPGGFFDWPIHLHHSHKTGLTIGAVHNYCNAVLWQYHKE